MGYRPKQRILSKGISNGQKTLKEMFNVISHGHTQYVLTYKWKLATKYRITMPQTTDPKKLSNKMTSCF